MAKKKIAALVTVYHKWSHADVIVGKILEGYNYDGGAGPNMQVVSMYVDQHPAGDMSDTSMVHVLTPEFAKASRVIADRRIALAGYRLADLLNQLLGK